MLSSTLWVLVMVTSLNHPRAHVGVRLAVPYETRFTCEEGQREVLRRKDEVFAYAERVLKAEKRHITVRRFTTECAPTAPSI